MKKVLIISTSPRKGGNSDILADEFAKGAREAGHEAEKICLYDKTINFCKGCLACQKTQPSAADDEESAVDGAVNGLKGWIACFEKAQFKGVVKGVGAANPGDIRKMPTRLEEARIMGKNV